MNAYICYDHGGRGESDENGQDESLSQPSGDSYQVDFPENGWEDIRKAQLLSFEFGMSNVVAYFVTRSVVDGKLAGDIKSINKSADNLFICGHIQNILCVQVDKMVFIKCKCLPEMRKDHVYFIKLVIRSEAESVIVYAECGCPAGRGPMGSCKHIAALAYALVDFGRTRSLPEYRTCTDVLQQWNRPRPRHVEIIPVSELGSHRRQLTPSVKSAGSGVMFDPRPANCVNIDIPNRLERLRCDLLAIDQPCALLNVLVPSVASIDHTYCKVVADNINTNNANQIASISDFVELEEKTTTAEEVLERLNLTHEERVQLELDTRSQSECDRWHEARRVRITGSKCGRVIIQKEKTIPLLRFCLYPKPMIHLPKPIAWGRKNEPKARRKYTDYMNSTGHIGLLTSDAGFVVHEEKPWLGASPDAWVIDHSVSDHKGIAEFKCPYREADMSLEEACQRSDFCCSMVDGKIYLRENHFYYHQVQLQLYVAATSCYWCDFCVYTTKDIGVQRIYPDDSWVHHTCPKLDEYYFDHILPEIVAQKHKPSYYY